MVGSVATIQRTRASKRHRSTRRGMAGTLRRKGGRGGAAAQGGQPRRAGGGWCGRWRRRGRTCGAPLCDGATLTDQERGGEPDEGAVAVEAIPAPALVVVEATFAGGVFVGLFNGPATMRQ